MDFCHLEIMVVVGNFFFAFFYNARPRMYVCACVCTFVYEMRLFGAYAANSANSGSFKVSVRFVRFTRLCLVAQ